MIDVRRQPAFMASDEMLSGALRRDPEKVGTWAKTLPAASSVVVYCVHGHEVSQRAAGALRELGLNLGDRKRIVGAQGLASPARTAYPLHARLWGSRSDREGEFLHPGPDGRP